MESESDQFKFNSGEESRQVLYVNIYNGDIKGSKAVEVTDMSKEKAWVEISKNVAVIVMELLVTQVATYFSIHIFRKLMKCENVWNDGAHSSNRSEDSESEIDWVMWWIGKEFGVNPSAEGRKEREILQRGLNEK